MFTTLTPEQETMVRTMAPNAIREFSMRFMLGVAIGELYNVGVPEEEIREVIELSFASLHARPTKPWRGITG